MINYVEEMQEAREAVNYAFITIKQKYIRFDKTAFFVFEGKDEIHFYEACANYCFPSGWEILSLPAGGKDEVARTYRSLDWEAYEKRRIIFFMDRDFSEYLPECKDPEDFNIYYTDGYSLENSICCYHTLQILLKSHINLDYLTSEDISFLENVYLESVRTITPSMTEVTAHCIAWQQDKKKPNLKNYSHKKIVSFEAGRAILVMSRDERLRHLFTSTNMDYCQDAIDEERLCELTKVISERGYHLATRGKYRLELFIELIKSLDNYMLPSGCKLSGLSNVDYGKIMHYSIPIHSLKEFLSSISKELGRE